MKNNDMRWICHNCERHQTITYADGSLGIGCMAYNVESGYPADIRNMKDCPLGKHEKK